MRRLWKLGLLFAVLGAGAWFALLAYLNSEHALQQAAQKIAVAINTKVGVGGLEVGVHGCAVKQLQVFESDSSSAEPFLVAERVETDITMSDLIQGTAEPKQVTLVRPQILVRHDADGRLLTQFPKVKPSDKPLPQIRVQDATLTVRKTGEPEAIFQKINVELKTEDGKLQLSGSADDPNWGGNWQIAGVIPKGPGPCAIHLKNAGLHISQPMLQRVPYVPAKVWQHVKLDGDTPVDLKLILGAPRDKILYRIELSPINTAVFVSSINLTASLARGHAVIENERVLLTDVRGVVADGELALTSADLDFRPVNTIMHFDLIAKNLKIKGLPPQWKLPPRLGGLLSGKAKITVQVVNGVAIPSGNGEGQVYNAMVGPIPVPNYGLRVQADQYGFRFEPLLANSIIPILRSANVP